MFKARTTGRSETGGFDHGFAEEDWWAANAEAREAMIAVAARWDVICYSYLVRESEMLSA